MLSPGSAHLLLRLLVQLVADLFGDVAAIRLVLADIALSQAMLRVGARGRCVLRRHDGQPRRVMSLLWFELASQVNLVVIRVQLAFP